ncbi:MAG: autotransporter-associated beta strand repeat-containing protein, partial [Clostridia bacterium]|nr:autotransporter-associated beta strand repeat-containing protein [Clostridia bacterium]
DGQFRAGDEVVFGSAATVCLAGAVNPSDVTVSNNTGNVVFNASAEGGYIAGPTKLTKKGEGTLTVNTANTYTGGTDIYGGTLVLGVTNALGSGAVLVRNATLDMNGKALPNDIRLDVAGQILNGVDYRGNFTLNGDLDGNSELYLAVNKTATLLSGNLNGKLIGTGKVVKKDSGTVVVNAANSYSGGTQISGGMLRLGINHALGSGAVTMEGGSLDMNGKLLNNNITVSGSASILNGTNYRGNFTLNGRA